MYKSLIFTQKILLLKLGVTRNSSASQKGSATRKKFRSTGLSYIKDKHCFEIYNKNELCYKNIE